MRHDAIPLGLTGFVLVTRRSADMSGALVQLLSAWNLAFPPILSQPTKIPTERIFKPLIIYTVNLQFITSSPWFKCPIKVVLYMSTEPLRLRVPMLLTSSVADALHLTCQ